MKLLFLYLGMAILGYFVGSRLRNAKGPWSLFSKAATLSVFILVFIMGSRIGGDPRVLESLGSIGLTALFITLACFVGSVAFVFLARKWMGIDKKGMKI
jgi:hypothetical protein